MTFQSFVLLMICFLQRVNLFLCISFSNCYLSLPLPPIYFSLFLLSFLFYILLVFYSLSPLINDFLVFVSCYTLPRDSFEAVVKDLIMWWCSFPAGLSLKFSSNFWFRQLLYNDCILSSCSSLTLYFGMFAMPNPIVFLKVMFSIRNFNVRFHKKIIAATMASPKTLTSFVIKLKI